MKLIAAILKNELPDDHLYWVKACEELSGKVDYDVIELTRNDWLERLKQRSYDVLLTKPGGVSSRFKQLYDERIYIISNVLGLPLFPTAEEVIIYENKRFLSYWLSAHKIPHPATNVFYFRDEATDFLCNTNYPLVAKTNIGASGSGVVILKGLEDAIKYVNNTFLGKGASQRTGPNLEKGGLLRRGLRYVLHPSSIKKKLSIYKSRASDLQQGFVIFQDYIQHVYEWRAVRIGNSFFAHKKMLKGEKASGSLIKGYDNPPPELFDFVKQITDMHGFYSQAVDLFETPNGYLVNEMQCIFGQSDPYQMLINSVPGRYVFRNDEWVFEAGNFARNACYNLRLEFLIEQFLNNKDKKR